ncbi:MAG: hypothetical protein ACRDPK_01530 [Carbonactinosporaceae bacterium]
MPRMLPAALLAMAVLAGCGAGLEPVRSWSSPTPNATTSGRPNNQALGLAARAIVARAAEVTASARSVRVTGVVATDYGDSVALDLRFNSTGGGGRIIDDGQALAVLRVGDDLWVRGDEQFWYRVGGVPAAEAFGSRYLELPTSGSTFPGLVLATRLTSLVPRLVHPQGRYARGEVRRVNGHRAIAIRHRVAGQRAGRAGVVWVATKGPPYIMRIASWTPGLGREVVDFTGYGRRYGLTPPDPARVADGGAFTAG